MAWLALLALVVSTFQAQQAPVPAPAPASAASHADEPYVVERTDHDVRFERDGTGRRVWSARVRMQNDAGVQRWGQLAIGYMTANERVEFGRIEVRKPDGTVTVVDPTGAQDLAVPIAGDAPVYTDFRQRHVTIPSLRPGDILSFEVTVVVHTAVVGDHFWYSFDFEDEEIVLDERLRLDLPSDRAVTLRVRPGVETVPADAASGPSGNGRTQYAWRASHTTHEAPPPDVANESGIQVLRRLRSPASPAIQLTTFASWEAVARWYAGLVQASTAADPAIAAKAAELTRTRTTPIDKLEALYDFVAKDIRYVSLSFGRGRFAPHRASEVLTNQYGDCKDKHTLLAALAKAVGLDVYPVLIHSVLTLDVALPSPTQFDHVISVMPAGATTADWIWVDTTPGVVPFRLLSPLLRGQQALLAVDAARVRGAAWWPALGDPRPLVGVPRDLPFPSKTAAEIAGSIDAQGKLDARVTLTMRGDVEFAMRPSLRLVPRTAWKEVGDAMAKANWVGGTISDLTVSDPAATNEPLQMRYRHERVNFLDFSKATASLAMPVEQSTFEGMSEQDWETTEPVEVLELGEAVVRVRLELPPGVKVRVPVDVTLTRDYIEYRSVHTFQNNVATMERTMRYLKRALPPSRKDDYLAFVRAVRADQAQRFVLDLGRGTATSTAGAPSGAAANDAKALYAAAYRAYEGRRYAEAVDLYKKLVELEPKHQFGWNNLGRAYSALSRYDEAIAAFNQQIAINPYDQYSYNNLGHALRRRERFDEAEQAFRKQIEISPLDKFAHGNLGQMLVDRKRYADAVPVLERAAAVTPDDAMLHVRLGTAYLRVSREADAKAAFARAVGIRAAPLIWNAVAYELALNGTQLDLALQYAQSAVTTLGTTLRQVTLDTVTVPQLGNVTLLAAAWDTLGWVHWAKGDLAQAERYVRAGWRLGQRAEIGGHLGQIYERQNRTDDAIATFAQALSAVGPAEGVRERLAKLVPDAKIETLKAIQQSGLHERRTFLVARRLKQEASAEFFVLLDSTAKVADVKFIKGDEALRPFVEPLRAIPYAVDWPDAAPVKLVRRGIVSCRAGTGECRFVLYMPGDVTSVD